MQREFYTITRKDLFDLFERLSAGHRVFVPYAVRERFFFAEFDPVKADLIELGGIRQSQPFKTFLNSPREQFADASERDSRPVIVAGVKSCDLQSLVLQDFVFKEGDYSDPLYIRRREDTIIIGCDCTCAKETCFCIAMDGAPYPLKNFDMNISPIEGGFVVEVASGKARQIISGYRTFFRQSDGRAMAARDANRERVSEEVKGFVDRRGTPGVAQIKGMVKKNYNSVEFWQDFASTCIECGACNLACPTCHCFLIYDEKSRGITRRGRVWDSCLYKTFARVAGGANPRKHLYERLRNRFEKKFDFFPQVLDYFACTGCGRCIEACPGDIDIREVLKGLVLGKWNKPPND